MIVIYTLPVRGLDIPIFLKNPCPGYIEKKEGAMHRTLRYPGDIPRSHEEFTCKAAFPPKLPGTIYPRNFFPPDLLLAAFP